MPMRWPLQAVERLKAGTPSHGKGRSSAEPGPRLVPAAPPSPCLMSLPEVLHRYGFRAERSSRPEEDLRMQRPTPEWGRGGRPTATRDQAATTTLRPKRRKPRRRFPPEVLSDEEVRALLDACPGTHTGVRNR